MEVFIEDVQPGTYDPNVPYDIPFDYWIKVILKDDQKINILTETFEKPWI